MSDKFSLYQTDGLWGIIENASNEKQTSIKSYFGSDLIIKRLNEQADQINQLKQQNEELMLQLNRQNVEEHKPVYCTLAGTECEYLGNVDELKQQLAEKDKEINSLIVDYEKRISHEQELMSNMEHRLTEKQNTIDEINKEFVQAVHDWKALCAEKDTRIAELEDKDWYEACIKQLEEQNNRLIDTLKEKDEKIKKLRFDTQRYANDYREMALTRQIGMKHLAINELEKAKASADKWFESWETSKYEGNIYDKLDVSNAYLQMSCEIDQQIKELKGENK